MKDHNLSNATRATDSKHVSGTRPINDSEHSSATKANSCPVVTRVNKINANQNKVKIT
jgi:hypothetical protein